MNECLKIQYKLLIQCYQEERASVWKSRNLDCSLGSVTSLGTSRKPFSLTELHLSCLKILFYYLLHLPTGTAVVRMKCDNGCGKLKAQQTEGLLYLCLGFASGSYLLAFGFPGSRTTYCGLTSCYQSGLSVANTRSQLWLFYF